MVSTGTLVVIVVVCTIVAIALSIYATERHTKKQKD